MEKLKLQSVLKRLIDKEKIKLRALSKATGVPQATLSSYLVGGGSNKPQHIRSLARHFGVSMEYLLFEDGSELDARFEQLPLERIFDGWVKLKIEKVAATKLKKGKDE